MSEPFHISGYWQDGTSSAILPATLIIEGSNLTLDIHSHSATSFPISDLKISAKIAKTPRYIEFAELLGQFESIDHEHLDRLTDRIPRKRSDFIHRLERHLLMVGFATLSVIILACSYFIWGIPIASKLIAQHIPDTVLHQATKETLKILELNYLKPSTLSEEAQNEVKALIGKYSPEYDSRKFIIRNGGDLGANAFALPDGSILFTDQIILLATGNDAELLGVFGHELGHVHYRHALRHILQNSAIAVTIAMIGGDVSAVGDLVLTLPVVFSQLSFSREFELEADRYGASYLEQRQLERGALVRMLTKLHASHAECETDADKNSCKRSETLFKYLSTHPALDDRIEAIQHRQ